MIFSVNGASHFRYFSSHSLRRIVVTGLGIVCPLGCGVGSVWNRLLEGKSGVTRLEGDAYDKLPCKIAALVPAEESRLEQHFSKSEMRTMSKASLYALLATREALEDATLTNLTEEQKERMGVAVGMGMCDLDTIVESAFSLRDRGYSRLSPYFVPVILNNMAAGQISMKYGFLGPIHTVSTACATGAHAVGDAFHFIRRGCADVMVCGGTEAVVTPLGIAGFCRARALSTSFNDEPMKASRPFDVKREGFVMGEGAGILVLEELQHALSRNARIYAEVLGYGLTGDACHLTAPREDGKSVIRCMRNAVEEGEVSLQDVGYVNAHATSTPLGDLAECRAIQSLFRDDFPRLLVSSTKGAVGHLLGAAGAVETLFTVMTCSTGWIPPTLNCEEVDPDIDVRLVTRKMQKWPETRRVALCNSFGFGGTNASLCISSYEKTL